jgi:AraC-like DNA-binding protein
MRHSDWCAHALPLNDRLFREPFYVTHAGWERVKPHQAYPHGGQPQYYEISWDEGRVLGEFCLSLITSGEGEVESEMGRQRVKAVRAWLYKPGEWHRHRPTPAIGWTNQWIKFNGSLPHQWMQDGVFRLKGNLVELEQAALFERQFRRLVESINAADGRNSLQFSWQAIGLLSHFLGDNSPGESFVAGKSGDATVDAVKAFIWSQSHNQIGVSDVASRMGINRRTLERCFKRAAGTTLLHEIQKCRLSRAALLLRETDVPIKYVVGRAGFNSYQQMRLVFKKHYSLSPENYRGKRR